MKYKEFQMQVNIVSYFGFELRDLYKWEYAISFEIPLWRAHLDLHLGSFH